MSEWLEMRQDSMATVTHNNARWMLETFALPSLGPKPLVTITAPDVLQALRVVEARGKLETAHRLRARISEIFRYAIATGRALSDPCRDLRGAIKPKRPTKHHAALIDSKAVCRLMLKIHHYGGSAEVKAALKLASLLLVRPGELRHARWADFDLDGTVPAWRFHVQKTRTEHIVPLQTQAVAILRELKPLTSGRKLGSQPAPGYLFPSNRSAVKPMSENTITLALRRLGFGGDQMTGHGFRAMARTLLSEHGWMPDIIERQLGHRAAGPLGAAYDRAQFLKERIQMMQEWANYLDDLKNDTEVREEVKRQIPEPLAA
jgi:integrase